MITENFANVLIDIAASLGVAAVTAILLASLALLVFLIIGRVKLFKKCGQAGWKAIIPFYSSYVLIKDICCLHTVWAVAAVIMSFISIESTAFLILAKFIDAMSFYNLAIKTKQDKVVTTVFGALTPAITIMVIGLNKSQYDPSIETRQHGMF